MMKDMKFTVKLEDVDDVLAAEWRDANKKLRELEEKLLTAYRGSERFSMANDLSGMKGMGTKVNMSVSNGNIDVTLRVQLDDGVAANPLRTLDHTTINLLLNGKLLDDRQKRELLRQIGFDVNTLVEGIERRKGDGAETAGKGRDREEEDDRPW